MLWKFPISCLFSFQSSLVYTHLTVILVVSFASASCSSFAWSSFPPAQVKVTSSFWKPLVFLCSVTLKVWSCGRELICAHGSVSSECAKIEKDQMCEKCPACVKTSIWPLQFFLFLFYFSRSYSHAHLFSRIALLLTINTTISLYTTTNFLLRLDPN